MQPYEELIKQLGEVIGVPLEPDPRQSCCIFFPADDVTLQIDLDTQGDRILVGSELGTLPPGTQREQALRQAMKVNGLPRSPRGHLAFSDRKDSLILYQFFKLANLDAVKLHSQLTRIVNHARLWKEALAKGEIPRIEETPTGVSGMLGQI